MFRASSVPVPATLTLAAVLSAGAPALAGGPPPPTPPLYGYHCDATVFPLLPDIYSGLHGTMEGVCFTGHTGAVPYPGNAALVLPGSEDRVVLSSSSLLSRRPSSTVSAWFHSFLGGDEQYPIYGERDSCGFNVFWVGLERRPGEVPGLTFGIFDEDGGGCGFGTWHVLSSGVEPTPGVWHHVAAVLDETSGMTLYLDGVPIASNASTATYVGVGSGDSTIGHIHTPGYPGYWPSKLDDVGLWAKALTPPEVMWLATNSLADLPPAAYPTFCLGDGSGTACPCDNESSPASEAGCRSSIGSGGALRGYGNAGVAADTFALTASQLPTTTIGVFIQGTTQAAGGVGTVFGDGLLCVGGTVLRLAAKTASGGVAYYPHPGNTPLSVRGAIPVGGATREYQFWYRNSAAFCTASPFNLTNGVTVTWEP